MARVLDPLLQALILPVLDNAVEPVEQVRALVRSGTASWMIVTVRATVLTLCLDPLSSFGRCGAPTVPCQAVCPAFPRPLPFAFASTIP